MTDETEETKWGGFTRKLKKQIKTPTETRDWGQVMKDGVIEGFYGNWDKAIDEFDNILNNTFENVHWSRRKDAYLYKAMCLQNLGKIDEAGKNFDKVIEGDPDDWESPINKGQMLYEDGRVVDAIFSLKKGLERLSEDEPETRAECLAQLAAAYGDLEESKREEENIKLALEYVDEAIKLSPDNLFVLQTKIYVLIDERLEKYDEALQLCDKTIEAGDHNDNFQYTKGLIYLNTGKNELALECFSNIESEVNDTVHHYNLACVHAMLGNKEEAINHLTTSLYIDPEQVNELEDDESFDNIRDSKEFKKLEKLTLAHNIAGYIVDE